jgi:hypothetical protein
MGTKRNPGQYDCYAKAEPDEPMFVLLARDPTAPQLVRDWAVRNFQQLSSDKLNSAAATQPMPISTPTTTRTVDYLLLYAGACMV